MTQTNPLLARVRIPGQRFTLPSGGLFYTNGELDPAVVNGEIEVLPMTMVDDLVLKTPDKLLNGDGVVEVFSRCVPQVLKPWELLSKDVDFLIVCLRIVTYGNMVEITTTHNACSHVVQNQEGEDVRLERPYKVNVTELLRQTKPIDPTTMDDVYKATLSNGQTLELRPLRYRAFIDLMQTQIEDISNEPAEASVNRMVAMLVDSILRVDDTTDSQMIGEWLAAATPTLVQEINEKLSGTFNWGTDLSTKVGCVDCGEPVELVVPIDPLSFFS